MGSMARAELARKIGVSKQTVGYWVQGRIQNMSADNLHAVARELGVSVEWLRSGRGPKEGASTELHQVSYKGTSAQPVVDLADYTFIPRYNVSVAAGGGAQPYDVNTDKHLAFRNEWLMTKPFSIPDLVLVTAEGDSMEPGINDGDILLVDTSRREIRDGKVYVLEVAGDVRVKRLFWRADGSLLISSDSQSPDHRDEEVPAGALEIMRIVGQVVWRGGEI